MNIFNQTQPIIIGVDSGYGNIKTAHFCFPTAVTAHDKEPTFKMNLLVYNGRKTGWFYFIPSACWRDIAFGILSTTRFLGMLMMPSGLRYAVYDIGDGKMEWQLRAEGSLFYTKRGNYETRATGMLFVCSDERRIEIAQQMP